MFVIIAKRRTEHARGARVDSLMFGKQAALAGGGGAAMMQSMGVDAATAAALAAAMGLDGGADGSGFQDGEAFNGEARTLIKFSINNRAAGCQRVTESQVFHCN